MKLGKIILQSRFCYKSWIHFISVIHHLTRSHPPGNNFIILLELWGKQTHGRTNFLWSSSAEVLYIMDTYLRMRTILFFRFFTWTWTVLKNRSSFPPGLLYKQLLKYELLLLHLKLVPHFLSVPQMDLGPCKKKTQSSVSQQRCGSAESQDDKMTTFRNMILTDTTSQKAKCHTCDILKKWRLKRGIKHWISIIP